MSKKSFKNIALRNSAEWEMFSEDDKKYGAGPVTTYFFYLGNDTYAQQASLLYSLFREEEYSENQERASRITMLFEIALYSSLAQEQTKAEEYWQRVVQKRRELFPEKKVREVKTAYVWIYEAYALLKLGHYQEIASPTQTGFEGLLEGKGLYPEPRRNAGVYGLVEVMLTLSDYKLNPSDKGKVEAQQALATYKEENFRYGRLGYAVIFDLQFSYPDVFTPILPGPDPEQD